MEVFQMKEEKIIRIGREDLTMVRDETGEAKFYHRHCGLQGDHMIEIKATREDLIDAMSYSLWPLDNFVEVLRLGEDPGALHYLLKDMAQTMRGKLETLCEMIEKECGKIKVDVSYENCWGIDENQYLAVIKGK